MITMEQQKADTVRHFPATRLPTREVTRRAFLRAAAGAGTAAGGWLALRAAEPRAPLSARPPASDHSLITISGTPRERGQVYGRRFAKPLRQFLEQEIYQAFSDPQKTQEALLRYAAACQPAIRRLAPIIWDELHGMAEGSELRLEEIVLLTLHEELWHRGVLPHVEHCTATAIGPPVTQDGNTYVAESWDWFPQLYGQSQMLLWQRAEGPSVLAYSYPGLWIGAGVNSAGIALSWTSVGGIQTPQLSAGVPTYVLIAHLLYQPTLEAVVAESQRAERAGWFTLVLADGSGQLLNVEGSPQKTVVERDRGSLVRVYYGSREMTATPPGQPVPRHPQCQRMVDLIEGARGRMDGRRLQDFYGDHESTICKHFNTLDVMVFNATQREVHISRGPGCLGHWQRFSFA
jgi:isopenicillin-N N-acyltransferase-like protein